MHTVRDKATGQVNNLVADAFMTKEGTITAEIHPHACAQTSKDARRSSADGARSEGLSGEVQV